VNLDFWQAKTSGNERCADNVTHSIAFCD